ncbi:MAG: hypothetical protein ACPLRZ_02930 [Thermovenabulum sp.]|uniref:hypothetical protein n=1 Tax=Thermovenabulum sp. TaxID=3100335 RepID=UPI003C7D8735
MNLQKDIQKLEECIKTLESDLNSQLQESLVKSSIYIKLQKLLDEIVFFLSYISNGQGNKKQKDELIKAIKYKFIQIIILLFEETHKSMLKSAELMNFVEEELILVLNIEKLYKKLEEIEKKLREE